MCTYLILAVSWCTDWNWSHQCYSIIHTINTDQYRINCYISIISVIRDREPLNNKMSLCSVTLLSGLFQQTASTSSVRPTASLRGWRLQSKKTRTLERLWGNSRKDQKQYRCCSLAKRWLWILAINNKNNGLVYSIPVLSKWKALLPK